MIVVLEVILVVIGVSVLVHYYGHWEVVNENGDRVVRGSYSRCYAQWSAHPYRINSWKINKINQ